MEHVSMLPPWATGARCPPGHSGSFSQPRGKEAGVFTSHPSSVSKDFSREVLILHGPSRSLHSQAKRKPQAESRSHCLKQDSVRIYWRGQCTGVWSGSPPTATVPLFSIYTLRVPPCRPFPLILEYSQTTHTSRWLKQGRQGCPDLVCWALSNVGVHWVRG